MSRIIVLQQRRNVMAAVIFATAAVSLLVLVFVPPHGVEAFLHSPLSLSSSSSWKPVSLLPTTNSKSSHRHNKGGPPLHALLQESDQREKKQDHPSESPSCPGDAAEGTRHNNDSDDDNFTLHIGRALDTLRNEYPHLLTQSPDYTLYDEHNMSLCVDLPTAPLTALTYNSVYGLSRYKMVWDMLHTVLALVYNMDQSYMSSVKLCHDRVRGNVLRVHWHAVLLPRWQKPEAASTGVVVGASSSHQHHPPSSKCHHWDGISVYELDWATGKIVQHRVEQVVYTHSAVPPILVMDDVMLRQAAKVIGGGIPVRLVEHSTDGSSCGSLSSSSSSSSSNLSPDNEMGNFMVQFRSPMYHSFRPSSLFAMEAEQPAKRPPSVPTTANNNNNKLPLPNDVVALSITPSTDTKHDALAVDETSALATTAAAADMVAMIDMVAFDAKNKSRQKFGLKPLSVEEFVNIENQVEQLARTQQEAIQAAKLLAQQQQAEKEAAAGPSIFDKVFGSVMKNLDTCESNFDCVRPQVCCDYVFAKKCCTSGSPILSNTSKQLQYARIPVYGGDNKPFPPQQR